MEISLSWEKERLQIEKNFGREAIWKMSDKPIEDIEVIPTGNISLDLALGVGGYARGRIVEVYGPESSGKTTLSLHAIAEAQKLGGLCVFVDAEHALDPGYAEAIGVDVDSLWISQPESGEEGLEIAKHAAQSGDIALVVIDSVAALTPRAELAGDIGDAHVGLQARLMSQSMRLLRAPAARNGCTLLFINQIREKIGVMFGSPETTPGGRALKFYASQRLDIRRQKQVKEGEDIVANETKVKVVKNKVAPPFRTATFDIEFGKGISQASSLLDLGVEAGCIIKSGAWYSDWNGVQMGQGRQAAKLTLNSDHDMMSELYEKIMDYVESDDV